MSVIAPRQRRTDGRPATPEAAALTAPAEAIPPVALDHEELVVRRGARSGLHVIVAVHSTVLGPSLGGVRVWRYPSTGDGMRDALRLARAMTMKAAAAGLDLGGGKGVICLPHGGASAGEERRAMLLDFGDLVESLDGRYITAEDAGSTAEDLVTIRERTAHVAGLPADRGGSGDPSPFTARGVEAAMRACARERLGSPELRGLRVAIVGVGNVGSRLARRLAEQGAQLILCDIDRGKRALAEGLDAEWVEPADAAATECEILAPCALGGAIHDGNLDALRCAIVCGSANNQLARDGLAEELAARDIAYAPDFIANSGGLISVCRELGAYGDDEALRLVDGIEGTMGHVLRTARERSTTPLRAAAQLAEERLEAAGARCAPDAPRRLSFTRGES